VQHLPLEFEQKWISLEGVVEQESKIVVGARRHFAAAGPAQRNDCERFLVSKSRLLLLGPIPDQARVNGRPGGGNQAAVSQLGAPDEPVIFGDQPLKSQERT
jgi:hypothetical protein